MATSLSETRLAPGLLLAMPQLDDLNFSRAVVLMIEHGDEGSFGLVVNQPSELSAGELLASLDLPWNGPANATIWAGGPVMPTSGWVLHSPITSIEDTSSELAGGTTVVLSEDLWLSTSPDKLRLIAETPPERVRILLGYAGWGPGQLAAEMASGSWLHADADAAILFDTPPDKMWSAALKSLGIDPETIVASRGVH